MAAVGKARASADAPPHLRHAFTEKDSMLYALDLGCGSEAGDDGDLRYGNERGLVVLPTMAVVLASPGNLGSRARHRPPTIASF
jgi:hypothetical protein